MTWKSGTGGRYRAANRTGYPICVDPAAVRLARNRLRENIECMTRKNYRDLAEFGLPLVKPDDPAFASMVRDIESRPQPFGPRPIGDLDTAAVLLNQSGKAIIVFAYIWRYRKIDGATRTSRFSNLGSSMQMDVLSGRSQAVRDLGSFILSGSKRLITEEGTFGNNLDVLQPHELPPHGAGYMAAGGGRGFGREISHERIGAIELSLDVAVFEDGLCVGSDEFGLFDSMTEGLERQRSAAEEAAKALRRGASEGQTGDLDSIWSPERSLVEVGLHTDSRIPGLWTPRGLRVMGATVVWYTACFRARARSLRVWKFSVARGFSKSLTCVAGWRQRAQRDM